ncbi:hypothetical protein Hanom_Chr06g00517691 [Helianthus anomalus]
MCVDDIVSKKESDMIYVCVCVLMCRSRVREGKRGQALNCFFVFDYKWRRLERRSHEDLGKDLDFAKIFKSVSDLDKI